MKFIQITDPHIVAPGELMVGLDPRERLRGAVANINSHHPDAEFCILTGDLVNNGEIAEYEALRECLNGLRIPYHLMMGNHDRRENMVAVFPETGRDRHGFIQGVLETSVGLFLLLDTHQAGEDWGSYCERRREWLAERLEQAGGRPVILFMHHPPFDIRLPGLDRIRLHDGEALAAVLEQGATIRHLFFGHVHRPIAGSWRGIPISSIPGTNHQVMLDFRPDVKVTKNHQPPAYAVVFLEAEQAIVHMHDFLADPDQTG